MVSVVEELWPSVTTGCGGGAVKFWEYIVGWRKDECVCVYVRVLVVLLFWVVSDFKIEKEKRND